MLVNSRHFITQKVVLTFVPGRLELHREQYIIYWLSLKPLIGAEIKFTSYSNSDRRGSLLPGWYAHISAPMSLRNHYQPIDDKLKSKAPIVREDSIGDEEDLVLESTVFFKLTQYQVWITSQFASYLAKGTKATELETKNENGSHQQHSEQHI